MNIIECMDKKLTDLRRNRAVQKDMIATAIKSLRFTEDEIDRLSCQMVSLVKMQKEERFREID